MSFNTEITIIGAGPYGLSIAAHLRKYDIDFRIVGNPMSTWLNNMPQGMLLKSAGFASNISDPDGVFSLSQYCMERSLPYKHIDFPIPLEVFCDYGMKFQERFVPDLEKTTVTSLDFGRGGFHITLENGDSFHSRKVVVAVGIDHFRHIPDVLRRLPDTLLSHSADHHDLRRFEDKEVLVLGSGASATNTAILLHEIGTKVCLISRKEKIDFGNPWLNVSNTLLKRLRSPISGIGPGWKSCIYTSAPWMYRYLPDETRLFTAKNYLAPSGGWFMKERARCVRTLTGYEVMAAYEKSDRVHLRLADKRRGVSVVEGDHVIAGTGYDPDVESIPFIANPILARIERVGKTPRLSAHFESSVRGLYFAGPITATSFGPAMRFMVGSDFTARRICRHLSRYRERKFRWKRMKGKVRAPVDFSI